MEKQLNNIKISQNQIKTVGIENKILSLICKRFYSNLIIDRYAKTVDPVVAIANRHNICTKSTRLILKTMEENKMIFTFRNNNGKRIIKVIPIMNGDKHG